MYHQAVNPITISDFPVRRDTYLHALRTKVQGDVRILAAWVEGSLGRGNADRYSDVDLHLLLEESDLASFKAAAESWLSDVHGLVLYTSMFGGPDYPSKGWTSRASCCQLRAEGWSNKS